MFSTCDIATDHGRLETEEPLEVLGREIFTFVSVTTWGYSPAINEEEKRKFMHAFPLIFYAISLLIKKRENDETFRTFIIVSPPDRGSMPAARKEESKEKGIDDSHHTNFTGKR